MNISNLPKAKVLAALYNGSKHQGMGFLQATGKTMTEAEAQQILEESGTHLYFDYLYGKVMKIDLSQSDLDTRLYNRDNGEGAAERILENL